MVRDNKQQQDHNIINDRVAIASDISCHSMYSETTTDHTSLTSFFATATENNLKATER